ncbi:protein FD-like [Ananas comosus]|uniref:Protein FD-like n=1 Tax=Ananas comosus TaxID=4615 RepID=A0A6P5FNQ3_ANACO|nr:protein FD-like [Ananas comosus]
MWCSFTHPNTNTNINNSSMSMSSSSSSSSSSSPSSMFSSQTTPRRRAMEDVWKDITLSTPTPHPHPHHVMMRPLATPSTTTHHYHHHHTTTPRHQRRRILQDFLAGTLNRPAPLAARSSDFRNSLRTRLPRRRRRRLRRGLLVVPLPGFSAADSPPNIFSLCEKKRPPESPDNGCCAGGSGGDRRHKRMIKNRESAARSRARRQAYTNGLELEVAHLLEENANLKKEQQEVNLPPS